LLIIILKTKINPQNCQWKQFVVIMCNRALKFSGKMTKYDHVHYFLNWYVTGSTKRGLIAFPNFNFSESYLLRVIEPLRMPTSLLKPLQYVTCSAKRGLIADPNCIYLKTHNLTCAFGATLKLGPNIPLTYHYSLV